MVTPSGPRLPRVLVVDDCPDDALALAALLAGWGHEVYLALDSPAALAVVVASRPDVVFLELGIPKVDGQEVAALLRARACPRRPLLAAVTAYSDARYRRLAAEAHFDFYLVKPAQPGELKRVLEVSAAGGPTTPAARLTLQ